MLNRKMMRDVWKNKVPFAAIFIMMFAGNFIFSGITSEYHGMDTYFQTFIKETGFADVLVSGDHFTIKDVSALKKMPGIEGAARRMFLPALRSTNEKQTIDLYILDHLNKKSAIKVVEGKPYNKKENGVWLDKKFAEENEIKLNDKINLKVNNMEIEKEIIGFCYLPEYIYYAKEGEMVPNHKNSGFAVMNEAAFPYAESISWNQLSVSGDGDVKKAILTILGTNAKSVILQKDHPSYSMISDEIKQHKEIGLLFAAVFLIIAILVTITTVHRLLNSERMQIGILKATGFQKRQLYYHYVSHSTVVCFVGSLAGWCCGFAVLPKILYLFMREMYTLPTMKPVMIKGSFLLPFFCALLCLMISFLSCKKYLAGNAAQILYSNSAEKEYRELPLPALWKCLSFYAQWNMRDIFRNKLRSFMTVFGVVGCVSIVFASLGLFTSINYVSAWVFHKMQTYECKVSGTFEDEEYKYKLLKSMNGEEFMTALIEVKWEEKEERIAFTGLKSQRYVKLFDNRNKEVKLEKGAALSKNIADQLKIKEGDILKWRFSGQEKWYSVRVEYIVRTPMVQGVTMLKSEMEKLQIPFQTTALIGNKPDAAEINSEYVSSVQNREDLISGFDFMLNASVMMCGIFLTAAILLGSVILYNLGTLFYMERYRDMATLKVLGFCDRRIRKLMIQQNLWLTAVGIGIGMPAGYYLQFIMLKTLQSSIDIIAYVPFSVYAASIFGTALLSFLISHLLSRKVCHINMVAALKANE